MPIDGLDVQYAVYNIASILILVIHAYAALLWLVVYSTYNVNKKENHTLKDRAYMFFEHH